MSRCKKNCNTSTLLPDFIAGMQAHGLPESRCTAALNRLCSYVVDAKILLCEFTITQMYGFVHYLYSLENESYTSADSHQDIYIIRLFYDYLVERGCGTENPVKKLREAAVRQLVEQLKEQVKGVKNE
jgi:site-specific recombinase XerD